MVNSTCSASSVPDDLPIPQNVSYAVVPSLSAPDTWMMQCCHPNPVHVVEQCWEWCELPANLTKQGTDAAQNQFQGCLTANKRPFNTSNALEVHVSSGRVEHAGSGFLLLALLVTWLHWV